jgi:hypothetical protein
LCVEVKCAVSLNSLWHAVCSNFAT